MMNKIIFTNSSTFAKSLTLHLRFQLPSLTLNFLISFGSMTTPLDEFSDATVRKAYEILLDTDKSIHPAFDGSDEFDFIDYNHFYKKLSEFKTNYTKKYIIPKISKHDVIALIEDSCEAFGYDANEQGTYLQKLFEISQNIC